MKKTIWAITLIVLIAASSLALAHSGRTDAYGGHWNRKDGTYHYHNTGTATQKPSTKKSSKNTKIAPSYIEEEAYLYGVTNRNDVFVFNAPWDRSDWNTLFPDEGTPVEIIGVAVDEYGDFWYRLSPDSASGYVFEDDLYIYYVDEYYSMY